MLNFGVDYETIDGTAIRDYIHVTDIANAHVLALKYLLNGCKTEAFNLGTGYGCSVKQVIQAVEEVASKKIPIIEKPRRPGDPAMLIADAKKAKKYLNWEPNMTSIDNITGTVWNWATTQQMLSKS